ncbi:MAG: carboxypeptidase-like regulatory domain-containing protein [Bacteroidales bacterium]|nr:carboxypeptidase-like regulatory domain-containing protein [Bacteroidales bacterium]
MNLRILSIFLLISCLYTGLTAQDNNDRQLVQFSGVVVTGDSLKPVSFTNISIRNSHRGTSTDFFGFFSFVARENDTIDFSAMGFKQTSFVIPDTLTNNRYSLIQMMTSDTIMLVETVIYPWPTAEQFKFAFLNIEIPDDDYERAMKNLAFLEMRERMEYMPMDGSMNYRNYISQQTARLYYAGQLPPNNLLNPFAWAQFIKAWKEGKFRNN